MPANIRISAQFPFPSGVSGTTPIAITKANGIWSVALPLGALATQLPAGGSLTTDYVLVWDSLSGTYFKMPISNIPTGPAGPPGAAGPPGPSGGITDAPSDGVNYGRKNAAWNNLDTLYAPIAGAAPIDALGWSGMQINGSFEVDQPNAGAAVSVPAGASAPFLMDGWSISKSGTNAFSVQQVASVFPGYIKELKLTVTTAEASIGTDLIDIIQKIEGFRIARLALGTASAQPITIGFWVKSSVAGILPLYAVNAGGTAGPTIFTATITSPNVAQFITATFPATTTGAWASDNTIGIVLGIRVASNTGINIAATIGNTFEMTGVVVLPGIEVPTAARAPFIMRPSDQELLTCMRYYEAWPLTSIYAAIAPGLAISTTNAIFILAYKAIKRAAPAFSISIAGDFVVMTNTGGVSVLTALSGSSFDLGSVQLSATTTGLVAGNATGLYRNNVNPAKLAFDARF